MSSEQLSERLGISTKTVQRYIELINRYLEDSDVEITSMRGYGFVFQGDVKQIEDLLVNLSENHYDRKIKDITRYLVSKEYITIEEIGRKMSYSASTLNKLIPQVKKYLAHYGLKLNSKPYYGICVIGEEQNIRDILIDCGFRKNHYGDLESLLINVGEGELETVKNTVVDYLQRHNVVIADADVTDLITRTVIIVSRCRQNCLLNGLEYNGQENMVQRMLSQVAGALHMLIPPQEVSYLSMYFNIVKGGLGGNKSIIEEDIISFVSDALEQMQGMYRNLTIQPQVREFLILHLTLMFNRLSHKRHVKNDLLQDIKANYTLEMNYAITFGKMIKEHFDMDVTEDELGYLALYFALGNNRDKKVKRVIIVCNYGMATSQLIKEQICDKFPDLEVMGIYPLYYLDAVANQDIDLIISTVALDPQKVSKPFIVMNQILDKDTFTDIQKAIDEPSGEGIAQYLHPEAFFVMKSRTKEEALSEMAENLIRLNFLTAGTVEKIYEREVISSTDIGNLVAVPHTLIGDDERSIIGIGILEKPIQWDKEKVQIIFMIGLSKKDAEQNNIFRRLYRTIKDVSRVNNLIEQKSFEAFAKLK